MRSSGIPPRELESEVIYTGSVLDIGSAMPECGVGAGMIGEGMNF